MKNILKEKLRGGKSIFGTFIGLGHLDIKAVLSRMVFDWRLLDEHNPKSLETMQVILQALDGTA